MLRTRLTRSGRIPFASFRRRNLSSPLWRTLRILRSLNRTPIPYEHQASDGFRTGEKAIHLVSAFATTSRLVLGQEAVPDKANELSAIPELLARLGEDGGLEGALVSIDAIATNATIASAIRAEGADYLLAVKANQPTLRAEVEAAFEEAPAVRLQTAVEVDKGHGRIEERRVQVLSDVDWLDGRRRFPGELRLPDVACLIRVESRVQLADKSRKDVRYFISLRRAKSRRPSVR